MEIKEAIKLEKGGTYAVQLQEPVSNEVLRRIKDQFGTFAEDSDIKFVILPKELKLVTKEVEVPDEN